MSRPRVLSLLLALLLVLAGASSAAAAEDEAPTGPGSVSGVVRDRLGVPMVGVHVSLDTWVTPRGSSRSRWFPRSMTTGTDGRYRFAGVPTPDDEVFVADVHAWAEGYANGAVRGVSARLRAAPTTPIVEDVVMRRRDLTMRGRVSVRGGTPEGATVTLTPVGDGADPDEGWIARVQEDGRWEQDVPAGRYRISAESTYGLRTWWPDVPAARPGPVTPVGLPGTTLDGLDVSMRLRQQGPAIDEYGQYHQGWDRDAVGPVGRYPRDPYRSVTVLRGGIATAGTPVSTYYLGLPRLPAGELITLTGHGIIGLEVPVTNTGDDVLWLGARVKGAISPASPCRWALTGGACSEEQPLLPGETRTVVVAPYTEAWAPEHAFDLVLTNADGPETRVPLRLRNVGLPEYGPDDWHNISGLLPYLSEELAEQAAIRLGTGPPLSPEIAALLRAMAAPPSPAATPPAPAPAVRRPPAVGVVTVRRTSVRFTFPAAGRVDVRLDRLVRSTDRRRPDRWARARAVTLKATRAGARTVRIKRLGVGPYRVRIVARIGGRVRRVTDYRDVKG